MAGPGQGKRGSLANWLQSTPKRPATDSKQPAGAKAPTPKSPATPTTPTSSLPRGRGRGRARLIAAPAQPPAVQRPGAGSAVPPLHLLQHAAVNTAALRQSPSTPARPNPTPARPNPTPANDLASCLIISPAIIREKRLREEEVDDPDPTGDSPPPLPHPDVVSESSQDSGPPISSKSSRAPRAYQVSWENEAAFKGWLAKNPPGRSKNKAAKCTVCDAELRAHRTDLLKHAQNSKHLANMERYNVAKQKRLDAMGVRIVRDEQKAIDLELAMYTALHTSIQSIDHLAMLLKSLGKGSKLENLRLHRTKCSQLIKNVISPALLSALVEDVADSPFSLIIDESTDVSVTKYLAIMIKYFSTSQGEMLTEFLGIIEVYRATAEALFNGVTEYLERIGIRWRNATGLGADGAQTLIGKHNSVFSRFKAEIPDIQLINCVCHSLHGAASKAAAEMPADLEFLVRETRNWFAKSPLRRLQYRDLYAAINNGDMPTTLVQLVKTRWLAWSKAIDVILNQWLELKTHFENHIKSLVPSDKCAIGRKLYEIYQGQQNRLLLYFLKPITAELNRVNLKFQSTEAEVPLLICELHELTLELARKFMEEAFIPRIPSNQVMTDEQVAQLKKNVNNPRAHLPPTSVDYGAAFRIHLGKIHLSAEELGSVQRRCIGYLVVLVQNLLQFLPEHSDRFAAMRHLMPAECLRRSGRADFFSLPLSLAAPGTDKDDLKRQWDRLPHTDWNAYFEGNIPDTSLVFWTEVWKYKVGQERRYKLLAEFVLRILTSPISNAVVERAFSKMNVIKVKQRNRILTKMLDALMRIRMWARGSGGRNRCCVNFEPTAEMYRLFTADIYEAEAGSGAAGRSGPQCDREELEETITLFAGCEDEPTAFDTE